MPESHALVTSDYNRMPTKPIIEGELAYEDMIDGCFRGPRNVSRPRMGADVMRDKAYWSVFAGGFGHTYGHNDVRVFWSPGMPKEAANRNHWQDALEASGAGQMRHLWSLIESRPWHTMVPDQSIIPAGQGPGGKHIRAARASDGVFLFVYLPRGDNVTINTTQVNGGKATAYWLNSCNGEAARIGEFPCHEPREFSPPTRRAGNDWVLVLDDATQDFPIPGSQGSQAPPRMSFWTLRGAACSSTSANTAQPP